MNASIIRVLPQQSLWIVHNQPHKSTIAPSFQIPPTKLVDRSYSAYKRTVACSSQIPPTKLVDRSYSAYKKGGDTPVPNSTNCSWWIVHIRPTEGLAHAIRNPT